MALEDINDLPDNPTSGQTGHREAHKDIHAGLKAVKEELDGRLSEEGLNGIYATSAPSAPLIATLDSLKNVTAKEWTS